MGCEGHDVGGAEWPDPGLDRYRSEIKQFGYVFLDVNGGVPKTCFEGASGAHVPMCSSASEYIGNAFGSAGVERERIWAHRKRILIDGRRARAHLSTLETHLDRQASSESAVCKSIASAKLTHEHTRYAFGTTGVERERS